MIKPTHGIVEKSKRKIDDNSILFKVEYLGNFVNSEIDSKAINHFLCHPDLEVRLSALSAVTLADFMCDEDRFSESMKDNFNHLDQVRDRLLKNYQVRFFGKVHV